MKNYHLAILKKPYLDAIINGSKPIESRFTKTKRFFFGRVTPGDKIFLKQTSGPVCATATVAEVKQFENLTPAKIVQLKNKYNKHILGSDEYWQSKADCRYGVLIWLTDVEPILPVRINKTDWRAWVVLTEKQNFGLLNPATLDLQKKHC